MVIVEAMGKESLVHRIAVSATHSKRFRLIVAVLVVLWLGLGLGIVPVENKYVEQPNIETYDDGLWWAVTTLTGVGYGDTYPMSGAGRAMGVVLQVFGVVMFGSVIAMISISLLRYQEDYYVRRMMERVDGIETKIGGLKKQLEFLIKDRS